MASDYPFDTGMEAYHSGVSRCGEIPFYDDYEDYEDYEDECLWVDEWDYAERNSEIKRLLPSTPEITLPSFDGPPNFNLVENIE